jgi:hypothetical protein
MLKTLFKTLTLVLALGFSFSAHASDELTEGKLQAQELMLSIDMQREASSLLKEMDDLGVEVGTTMDDSGGLIKALGMNETAAMGAKQKIDALLKIMDKSEDSEKIYKGYSEIDTLIKEIRTLNAESKTLAKQAQKK